jgi:hypothetical protein
MSGFRWTDRFGVVRALEAPAAIEAEVEEISAEIDATISKSKNEPRDVVVACREKIRDLVSRLDVLRSDADRWNAYAFEQAKVAAKQRVEEIQTLIEEAWDILIVAALHEERTETFTSDAERAAALAGPATDAQCRAIARSEREPKPSGDLTRAEAEEWLGADPALWRPLSDEGGWFSWVDADGITHRLSSPLQIEIEAANLVVTLDDLTPTLVESGSLDEINCALEATNDILYRILVLQSDLERFAQEQIGQEDAQWEQFEQEWERLRERQSQAQ